MKKILINIIYVFVAVVIAKFLGVFTSFFTAKFLQPANYGVWITASLIAVYAPILSFGSVETLLKMYPYYVGRNELTRAKEVEDGVLASVVLSAILLIIVGFAFNLLWKEKLSEALLEVVNIMFLTSGLSFFSSYFYHRFTAHQRFKHVSFIDSTRAILKFLLVVSFSWFWGLKGAALGLFLHELIICIYSGGLNHIVCGKLSTNYNLKLILDVIRVGLPITIVWWVFVVQTSVDRVISMSMLGKTATGYYGLGISIVSMLVLIPGVVGRVLYPKINEGVGRNLNEKEMTSLVIKPANALSLVISFAIGVLILFLPIVYLQLLPEYGDGLLSSQILLLGSFFVCLIRNGANYLIAIDKQNLLLKYFFISLVVNIICNYSLVKLGLNIEGIAMSTGFSGLLLASLIYRSAFKSMGYNRLKQIICIRNLYFPWLLVVTLFCIGVLANQELLIQNGISAVFHIIVFCLVFSICLYIIPCSRFSIKEIYQLIKK